MDDGEVEEVKIRKIGVLSLAGTFALVSLLSNIILSIIVSIVFPIIAGLVPIIQPYQPTLTYILIFCIGSTVVTFISFLILGLFYNLSALITKGIKLYS